MRVVPTGLRPEFYKMYSEPLQIFELYLEDPYTSPSHFFVANNQDIVFNGITYTALAIKRAPFKSEEGTIINELELALDNTDLEFKALVASGAFNKKRVVVKLVFANQLTDPANYITLLDGDLDEPKGDNRWVTMTVRPFAVLEREFPRRIFQVGCNYTFGDTDCTMERSTYRESKAISGASTGNTLVFADDSHVDDYWIPGYVEFTSGALDGQVRPISDSSGTLIVLRVSFWEAPAIGDTFIVQKLCSKNHTGCAGFNNYLNYGGFPHVPKKPQV